MYRRLVATIALSSAVWAAPALAQDAETEPEEASDTAAEGREEGETTSAADDSAPTDEEPAEGEPAGEAAPAARPAGEVLGPGGKPLRTDYPGTDESLKARMDTQMIEGSTVDSDAPTAAYGLRIRELETRIDDLKERVFQSKTRIVLLRETLLSGNLAGARAVISHRTELGSAWNIEQAYYALDGTRLANKSEPDPDLDDKDGFQVYDGSVSPGEHKLSVLVRYRGTNVGVFPYFKGYSGDIKSSCDFEVQEGKIAQILVNVYPDGGIGQSIEQRPFVECDVEYFDNVRDSNEAAPAPEEPSPEGGEE